MRTVKIIFIAFVLATLGGLVLFKLADYLPSQGPGSDFESLYGENEGEEQLEDFDINFKKLTGVIKPLGVSIYKEGTHRLEKDNSLLTLLESKEFDLDEYEHKEVELEGIIRDAIEDGLTIMNVSKIKVTDDLMEELNILDEVGYNFHFEYPSPWEYAKGVGKLIFYAEGDEKEIPLITILQYPNVDKPIEAWLDEQEEEIDFREIHIRVGDLAGYRKSGRDTEGTEVVKSYVKDEDNDAVYEIRYVGTNQVIKTHYLNIVDNFQIGTLEVEVEEAETEDEKDSMEEDTSESTEEITEELSGQEELSGEEMSPKETGAEIEEEKEKEEEEVPTNTVTNENLGGTGSRVTTLEPLSAEQVQKTIDGGYKLFAGKSLSFEYPKVWVFGFMGDGTYMMTDWSTYQSDNEELVLNHARVLILVGDQDQKCTYSQSSDLDGTAHTVCALESGLTTIIDYIAESLSK